MTTISSVGSNKGVLRPYLNQKRDFISYFLYFLHLEAYIVVGPHFVVNLHVVDDEWLCG